MTRSVRTMKVVTCVVVIRDSLPVEIHVAVSTDIIHIFSIFSFNNVNIILVFSNNVNIILAFSNNINIILAFQQLPAEVNIFWCFNIIFYFTFLKHVKVKKLL